MVDRWPLTGRGEELRFIGELLADDEHRGIVVAGEAGVGKTRLARDAIGAAPGGRAVRRVAGTTTGRTVALGAFARWSGAGDTNQASLVREVLTALTADVGGHPLLLFVDDAHLLDDLSAMVVHQLVLQDGARVVATVRSGQAAPDAITALWKDGLLHRMELQPLSRNESGVLLETVLGGAVNARAEERMWKLTLGNVLFLRHLIEHERESGRLSDEFGEWCWTGTPDVSPSLVELVELHIGAVADEVREVVDLVAIAEPLDRGRLATLAAPAAIETAEQRGLITTSPTGVVNVAHPLYGEIRLNQCGPSRLRRLRGVVARTMVSDTAADPLAIGLLWLDSDLAPDPDVLCRAAMTARARFDLASAERMARVAVDVAAGPEATLLLASILLLREDGHAMEEVLSSLRPEEMSPLDYHNGTNLRANNLLWTLGDREKAWAVVQDALQENPAHADVLRAFAAVWLVTAARPAEVLPMTSAVDYPRLDAFSRITGYSAETIALGDLGRPEQAAQRAGEAYRLLDESPQDSFQGTGVAEFHAHALAAAGYVEAAVDVAVTHYRRYAGSGGPAEAMARAALGMTELAMGDLTTARRHLAEASAALGDYGEILGLPYRFRIMYCQALARSGDSEAAVAALELAQRSRHTAYEYVESDFRLAQSWTAAVQGNVSGAREHSISAAEFAREHGQWAREVLALQAAALFGDAEVAERLAELADIVEGPRAAVALRFARALAGGDAAALEKASLEFEAMGDRLAAADAVAHASVCHRRAGRRGSALGDSARAQAIALECGGAVSPALTSALVRLPFTQREHEVAALLAQGKSNRDIAAAMALSVRTVEWYVYRAIGKAGVATRSELAALVSQFSANSGSI